MAFIPADPNGLYVPLDDFLQNPAYNIAPNAYYQKPAEYYLQGQGWQGWVGELKDALFKPFYAVDKLDSWLGGSGNAVWDVSKFAGGIVGGTAGNIVGGAASGLGSGFVNNFFQSPNGEGGFNFSGVLTIAAIGLVAYAVLK